MRKISSAVVFVGSHLSEEEFNDVSVRQKTLEQAIGAIEAGVEGLRIVNRNQLFCAITISGPAQSVTNLEVFLKESGLGHIESASKAALRAAGR